MNFHFPLILKDKSIRVYDLSFMIELLKTEYVQRWYFLSSLATQSFPTARCQKKFSPPLPVAPRPLVVGEDPSLPQVQSKGGGGGEEDGGEEEASRRRRKAKGETARPRRRHRNPAQVFYNVPYFSAKHRREQCGFYIARPWEVGRRRARDDFASRDKEGKTIAGGCRGDILYVQRKRGIALPLLFFLRSRDELMRALNSYVRTFTFLYFVVLVKE